VQISNTVLEQNLGFQAVITWHQCGNIKIYVRHSYYILACTMILGLHLLLKHVKVNKFNSIAVL